MMKETEGCGQRKAPATLRAEPGEEELATQSTQNSITQQSQVEKITVPREDTAHRQITRPQTLLLIR